MEENTSANDQAEKIASLQTMIANAEKAITNAKSELSKIQGKDYVSKNDFGQNLSSDDGQVTMGIFDGQVMQGEDGKQYPVPANYASKSKLVEGDTMKLTITDNGSFIYKQIGPVDRKYLIGITVRDDRGNYLVRTDEKNYQVLLAAATYFKIEAGDEITIIVPRDKDANWGAIENIVRKSVETPPIYPSNEFIPARPEKQNDFQQTTNTEEDTFNNADFLSNDNDKLKADSKQANQNRKDIEIEEMKNEKNITENETKPSAIEMLAKEIEEERKRQNEQSNDEIIDEWTPDIDALRKEAENKPVTEEA